MAIGRAIDGGNWGAGAVAMAAVALAELATAGVIVARGVVLDATGMLMTVGIAIGSIVLLVVSPVPRTAKALLIVAICAAGMTISVAQDPFGLRDVDDRVTAAAASSAPEPPTPADVAQSRPAAPEPSRVGGRVRITASADNRDAAFPPAIADGVARALSSAPTDAAITGVAGVEGEGGAPVYSLNWSVVTASATAWCGRTSATAPSRDRAVETLARRVAATAVRVSQGRRGCA